MLPYLLIVFFTTAISALFVVTLKLLFKNSNFLDNLYVLFFLFFIPAVSLYIYVTVGCVNICVVKEGQITNRYIKLYDTTYKLANGTTLDINSSSLQSTVMVINDSSTPLLFDLIGYSKTGNTSVEYGHKDIMPYSINSVSQYPDYFFAEPPHEIDVPTADAITIKGWLHTD